MSQNFDFSNVKEVDRKDIVELSERINAFHAGKEDEERFKHYRLTRGVYGQRQLGVQMFRTKIPFGKITTHQLLALADISEKYATGNLHITTRQNIQMHYVKLQDSPAVWTALAQNDLTAREACGNTVRNVTASAKAGIDPDELFDVTPYAQATFEFFLRNPICQDMGRKIKPAFSSSDKDSAFTYFHDFGFIPRIKMVDGKEKRGFKVVIGGGLGAVSMVAHEAHEFLPEDQIIPFMEACIRVFDRHGEREKRMKARMKFLVKKLGFDGFMELVNAERIAIKSQSVPIDINIVKQPTIPEDFEVEQIEIDNKEKYDLWLKTNVFEQKQQGFYAIQVKVLLGDISAETARKLAPAIQKYAADDIRLTVNQGMIIKYVRPKFLPHLFDVLNSLGLAEPGFNSTADITACPGTDTCALGVTNSTGLSKKLEEVIRDSFPSLIEETNIKIKISGCMNACGQHMAANIGFHGSSIKKNNMVIPAMQVVIGGGVDPEGKGFIAEKVIKLPTKRIPTALATILEDYEANAAEGVYFNDYYYSKGKRYFYNLLKPFAELEQLKETDFFDWGQDAQYIQEIGVGECAGVALDVVGTILKEASDKIKEAEEALQSERFADSIYHSYAGMVIGAKAMLLSKDVKCNTHRGIIEDFQTNYVENAEVVLALPFNETVLQINKNEPSNTFAQDYFTQARDFMKQIIAIRTAQLGQSNGQDKVVVGNYYKA